MRINQILNRRHFTMGMYKNLYMQYMDIEGIKYTNQDGERVRVSYSGDNKDSIPVYVIFDKDGSPTRSATI